MNGPPRWSSPSGNSGTKAIRPPRSAAGSACRRTRSWARRTGSTCQVVHHRSGGKAAAQPVRRADRRCLGWPKSCRWRRPSWCPPGFCPRPAGSHCGPHPRRPSQWHTLQQHALPAVRALLATAHAAGRSASRVSVVFASATRRRLSASLTAANTRSSPIAVFAAAMMTTAWRPLNDRLHQGAN